jgi:tripartite-type tricarboxylate transporter receptor subunit TctC
MARVVGNSVAKTLGRTVFVENRAGAAGLIGTRALQSAPTDGSTTLLHTFTGFAALPFSQKSANYDPVRDFLPVAAYAVGPAFLLVHSSVPARNVVELIAYVKSAPGLETATSGPGGWSDIWSAAFAKRANIELLLVPYKGGSEMSTALISGEAKLILSAYNEVFNAHVKSGKLRVLAVTTEQPSSLLPGVPTLQETLPGFVVDGWFGFHAMPSLPAAEAAAISEAIRKAVAEPGVREKLAALYVEPRYQSQAEFARTMAATTEAWRHVTAELKIAPK